MVRIETTKEAKRRFQKSGGAQWRPTRGQINAAEIWNKQEEKIRKDREREERKKRNAARQAERDARQKGVQQDMLNKGRITVEDTWGKVTASQNRLHRFFRPQQIPSTKFGGDETVLDDELHGEVEGQTKQSDFDCNSESNFNESKRKVTPDINGSQSLCCQLDPLQNYIYEQVPANHHFPGRPDSQNAVLPTQQSVRTRKRKRSFGTEEGREEMSQSVEAFESDPKAQREHVLTRNTQISSSVTYADLTSALRSEMLPPPRPTSEKRCSTDMHKSSPSFSKSAHHTAVERCPLTEMSASDLNVRANNKPDPEKRLKGKISLASEASNLLSSQIVKQTLCGLSSQDFTDGIDESDKENLSPVSKHDSVSSLRLVHAAPCPRKDLETVSRDGARQNESRTATEENPMTDDSDGADEFIDSGLDDESLLSIAATQQLKSDLLKTCTRLEYAQEQLCIEAENESPTNICMKSMSQLNTRQYIVAESFGLSGLDDDDIIGCVQNFEAQANDLSDDDLTCLMNCFEGSINEDLVQYKRGSLPWSRARGAIFEDEEGVNSSQKTQIIEE